MELFSSYTGFEFLTFYVALLLVSVAASFWIAARLRPLGGRASTLEAEEMAVLAEGTVRHAYTVATDLMVQGGLENASSGKLRVAKSSVARTGSAGRSVLRKVGAFTISELCVTTVQDAQAIRSRLIGDGLIMTDSEAAKLRWQVVAPFAGLLALGLYRAIAGYGEGEAIGFLIVLMLATFVIALWRYSKAPQRTAAGEQLLQAERERTSRLQRAPQAAEASYAVALFGAGILVGTPWEAVHAMKGTAIVQGSGATGCGGCGAGGSDGGGSGCGGGGCGGCGG